MTRMARRILLAAAWAASCIACFLGGWYLSASVAARGSSIRPVREGSAIAPTIIKLPPRPFISVVSAANPESRVNIFGRISDLKVITLATVYSGAEGDCSVSLYPSSGNVKSILVRRDEKRAREWGLREDGSLEYVTVYEKDGLRGRRQEFDNEGKLTRTVTEVVHGGS